MKRYQVASEAMALDTYEVMTLGEVVDTVHRSRAPKGVHIEVDDRRRLRASLVTIARRLGLRVTTGWAECWDSDPSHRCGHLWVVERDNGLT